MRGCLLQVVGLVFLTTGTMVLAGGWEARVVSDDSQVVERGPYRIQMPTHWFGRARIVDSKGKVFRRLSYERTDQLARLIPLGESHTFGEYGFDGANTILRLNKPIEVFLDSEKQVRDIVLPTEIEGALSYRYDLHEVAKALPVVKQRWKWRDPSVEGDLKSRTVVCLGAMCTFSAASMIEFVVGSMAGNEAVKIGGFIHLGAMFFSGINLLWTFEDANKEKRVGPLARTAALAAVDCAAHLALFLLPP